MLPLNQPLPLFSHYVWIAIIIGIATGCGTKKNIPAGEKEVITEAAPDWVNNRPHNSAYYIGIGSANKRTEPTEYQNTAKKNALNDLASEISVRVQGHTFMNSLEVNKTYTEEFMSTISTFTDEKIDDFEIVGSWENNQTYWVYYRLNKAIYQQQKAEKKNKALNAAYENYRKAKNAEAEINIPIAFDQYMQGLFAIKEYWKEVNNYTTETGENLYLDNELFSSLQNIATGLRIRTELSKIVLSSDNAFQTELPVYVEYNGKPAKGISITYTYPKEEYYKPRTLLTDSKGMVLIPINNVSPNANGLQLSVAIQLEPLQSPTLDKTIQSGLIKGWATDKKQVQIELLKPSFYIQSTELNFGQPITQILSSAATNELVKKGMRIAPSQKEADFLVQINSNTTDQGMVEGFHVAHLQIEITTSNIKSKQTVYQETFSAIKGLQLNTQAAGNEAYKKGKEKMEREIIKNLLQTIL